MKTYFAKESEVKRDWFIADARGRVLGRFASGIATVLRGKHKTSFTPHIDCGDGVIVINAKSIKVTGRKMSQKLYKTYSGYPSGLHQKKLEIMLRERPAKVITIAVKNMLPKNKIGRSMIKRLKVYADDKHPHQAQGPKELKINET